MKSPLYSAAAMLVVLAAYTIGISASPQQFGVPGEQRHQWPPRAKDIVNLSGRAELSPKKDFAIVYKVPADRWLILTAAVTTYGIADILQRKSGKDEQKLSYMTFLRTDTGSSMKESGPIGLKFVPGSLVILKHTTHRPQSIPYHIRGYLTDQ